VKIRTGLPSVRWQGPGSDAHILVQKIPQKKTRFRPKSRKQRGENFLAS
jgi:hypothetical protein